MISFISANNKKENKLSWKENMEFKLGKLLMAYLTCLCRKNCNSLSVNQVSSPNCLVQDSTIKMIKDEEAEK